MTAPISNGPTTTRLHHYAGHYSDGGCEREKVRPAYEKWPKIGGLWRAGRVSSHQPVLCQGLVDNAAHFRLAVVGVLQH